MTQLALQPSPSSVLPSSQVSWPDTRPSPHRIVDTHALFGAGHKKSCSTLLQSPEQPSPPSSLPSSHASPVCTLPSPQPAGSASVVTPESRGRGMGSVHVPESFRAIGLSKSPPSNVLWP